MALFYLTFKGRNRKVGKNQTVSITSKDSCPDACPFKTTSSCYAMFGPMNIHWSKVSAGLGYSQSEFLEKVTHIEAGRTWRYGQAGDLVGNVATSELDEEFVQGLIKANSGKKCYLYTHYDFSVGDNPLIIKESCENNVIINVSTQSFDKVDEAVDLGLLATVVVPSHYSKKRYTTPGGNSVRICPQQLGADIDCIRCGWCFREGRSFSVGFKAQGKRVKVIDRFLEENYFGGAYA